MTDPKYMRTSLDFACGKAVEEAGEFLQAMGKTLRWGWLSVNPDIPRDEQETNANWVKREMADLRGALDNLEREMFESLTGDGHMQAIRRELGSPTPAVTSKEG